MPQNTLEYVSVERSEGHPSGLALVASALLIVAGSLVYVFGMMMIGVALKRGEFEPRGLIPASIGGLICWVGMRLRRRRPVRH